MLAFPNAKINLGLKILRKRADGYHDIDSCLYPVPWRDVLELIPSDSFKFQQTGLKIPGDSKENLCVKAFELIREEKDIAPVQIHLHKVIPMGAGLGGGSADGAFTLKLLNALYQLEYTPHELEALASQLGSDCPFFIENKPVIASGTGTELQILDFSLKGAWIALKQPGLHVNTKEAYSQIVPQIPEIPIKEVVCSPIENWQTELTNDFEEGVFSMHPQIKLLKDELYTSGASYAAMSGSGSAVFGIFETKPSLEGYEVFELK